MSIPFRLALGALPLAIVVAAAPAGAQRFAPRADLPPLLEFVDGEPVRDARDFERRRAEIDELLREYFTGTFPATTPELVKSEVLEERRPGDGSLRRRVRLTWSTPKRRAFEVCVWVPAGEGPRPLLLTQPRSYQIPWAEMALARGYVVALYPGVDSHHREADYPGYESVWQEFRAEYPAATWAEIPTKAWLASRALDYLLAPASGFDVAAGQVGIIGFSRYGKQALIAAAFDPRITSVVARSPGSPGSCPYRFTSRDTCAEAPADFPGEWFRPSLRAFTGREHDLPIDAHGWYALIAPRHCLIHTAHNDGSEPTFAVERAYLQGREVYRLLGKPENLRVLYRPGQHGPITPEHRRQNLDWLDLSFGRGTARPDAFPEELIHHFDWRAWRERLPAADARPPVRLARSDAERRACVRWMLGAGPEEPELASRDEFFHDAESETMTHDRWAVGGVRRVPIRFGRGVRGNAYFRVDAKEPAPVVIWLHPLSYHSGYNEGYGVEGTTVYHRLAAAGFVVITHDQCGFGLRLLEGRGFYDRNPRWSRLGRMVHDARAAVDFAVDGRGRAKGPLPRTDPDRVALLGFSVGGLVALHAAALDDRVAAVASFAGFAPFRADTDARATGGNRRLWEWHALLPKLGLFHGREAGIPYDIDDLLRLLGSRPALIVAPTRDRSSDAAAVRALIDRAREARSNARLTAYQPDDIARFQKAQHERFLRWLRQAWPSDR